MQRSPWRTPPEKSVEPSGPRPSHRPTDELDTWVQNAIAEASGTVQAAWNRVIAAYMDGDISLGRAAQLLDLPRIELTERFNRLGTPLRLGPASVEEARAESALLLLS